MDYPNTPTNKNTESTALAQTCYILYLVSIAVPFLAIISVILAYVNKNQSSFWLSEHYRYQIRTFWMSLLYSAIGIITSPILIGWFILLFVAIWLIIRCINGLTTLAKQQPPQNINTWFF